jgi:hypothetical protein
MGVRVHVRRIGRRIAWALAACAVAAACDRIRDRWKPNTFEAEYIAAEEYRHLALLHVTVGEGRSARELRGSDFTTAGYGTPHSELLEVPSSGQLPIRVALVSAAGDTLASARLEFVLRPAHTYWVTVRAGGARPTGMCIGRVTAAPISPGKAGDSLFVTGGGMPRGAMC